MNWQTCISKLNLIILHLCAVNSATVGALLSKKYIRVPHPNPDVSVSALMDYGHPVRAFSNISQMFLLIHQIWRNTLRVIFGSNSSTKIVTITHLSLILQ